MIIHPDQPGRMPAPPKPTGSNGRIDPSRNGDGRAVQVPSSRDGQPLTQKPLENDHGRALPPGRTNIGRIDRQDIRADIHDVQDHWNNGDHDYHWHNWNGMNVCHHYDEFGFHWWGFYVGEVYFWTRYYNDSYWWFDPYWHRWVFMNAGQWWWQNPDGGMYLYDGSDYYQYATGDSGVIMTPDSTPPVDVPPGPATPANPATYSQDGTRAVQIVGDARDAYLYDLTADPDSAAGQGLWLATDVSEALFVNGTDGAVNEIILAVGSGSSWSTFDANGNPLESIAPKSFTPTSGANMIKALQMKTQGPAFGALKAGFNW